jgi:protein ImuB
MNHISRIACVNVPALPLQALLRDRPDWKDVAVAVVDRDKPQGMIQWVNERARAERLLPGMCYATGLSLSRDLRAGAVAETDIAETLDLLARRLWGFSPRIESSHREPGVFWLDASGLKEVYPSFDDWAEGIRSDLLEAGFDAIVAVGFSRFGSYAAAMSNADNIVFSHAEQERAHLRAVPIDRLCLDLKLRDMLLKLGMDTLGAFIDLPASGIRKRFGPEAHELYQMARGRGWSPIDPQPLLEPVEQRTLLDYAETNTARLLGIIAPLLRAVLAELFARHEALVSLRFSLLLDNKRKQSERLSQADPTLDARQLLSLIRLRLETFSISAGVVEVRIQADGVRAPQEQLDLFREAPHRNLAAVRHAFATIRAEFGNDSIVRARLYEGHLPDARFGWEALDNIGAPSIIPLSKTSTRPMIRRLHTPPVPLPPRARHEPDGWLIAGIADGPVEESIGPHIVSGGWWRKEIERAYYYVRTRKGRWLWIYYDQKRRRWFLQGEVQ